MTVCILSIETSCDETAAAVTYDGRRIAANVVASQADLHARFGGVVPELASRAHISHITAVVAEAMTRAGVTGHDLSAVAVVHTPGLIGSLLVGLTAAKTLAWCWAKPLLAVNHLHAHIHSCLMSQAGPVEFPAVALVVSGGHTALYRVDSPTAYQMLGATRDDAAGEAFDKVAAILRLGYPGGPLIDRLAVSGNPAAYNFPRALCDTDNLDFSFSGLKTAVLYTVRGTPGRRVRGSLPTPTQGQTGPPRGINAAPAKAYQTAGPTFTRAGETAGVAELDAAARADIAASFQAAVVDVLVRKTLRAAEVVGAAPILVGGGVAANQGLRAALTQAAAEAGRRVYFAPLALCTDNAAMAAVAYHEYVAGRFAALDLPAQAG